MKRYAESKTQDEMGDMQDGVYESPTGEYIKVDDLLAWLDAEITLTEENLGIIKQHNGGLKPLIQFEAILATYRAVKAHITG
jgi:hypothetical protein